MSDIRNTGSAVLPLLVAAAVAFAILAVGAARARALPAEIRDGDAAFRSAGWAEALRSRLGSVFGPLLVLLGGIALTYAVGCAFSAFSKLGTVIRLDRPVYDFFLHHRASSVTTVAAHVLTRPGDYDVIYTVTVVVGLGLLLWKRSLLPLVLLVVGVLLEKYLQKYTNLSVHTPKPPSASSVGHVGGCPSGGTARVIVTFGLASFLALRDRGLQRAVVVGWTLVAVLAAAEGWSRLYLGRHWFIDVVAGAVFGVVLLITLVLVAQLLPRRLSAFPGPYLRRVAWSRGTSHGSSPDGRPSGAPRPGDQSGALPQASETPAPAGPPPR